MQIYSEPLVGIKRRILKGPGKKYDNQFVMMTSPLSIIIVNYNGKAFLNECILSVMGSGVFEKEIIVVDNASADGSLELIKEKFHRLRLITLDRNYGFAEANNLGAQAAAGDYLVFLNNDTVVAPGWLDGLVAVLAADPRIGVAGSKLLFHGMPDRINSAGTAITMTGGGYDIGFMDPDSARYSTPGLRGGVCGAAMMVRRKEFLDLGGFDPRHFMYFEDVDLCWRYWLMGYKVAYVPGSVVYHRFGGSSGKDRHNPLRVFYGTRNSVLNVLKNFEGRNVIPSLLVNLFLHGVKFFLFFSTLRMKQALTILRAYRSVVQCLPELMKKRRRVQSERRIPDEYLFRRGLVVRLSASIQEHLRLMRFQKEIAGNSQRGLNG